LTSLVLIEGAEFHLDMIDFDCEKSDEGLADVRDILTFLRIKRGFIMDSGNSYHYLGFDFRSELEFLRLLERLPSYSRVGSSWSSYQKTKGFSVLRVTPCLKLGKQIPFLVERFENPLIDCAFMRTQYFIRKKYISVNAVTNQHQECNYSRASICRRINAPARI